MVLKVHRNHKVYQGRGEGGEGGMEVCVCVCVEGGGSYASLYTVTTRMTYALKWAAMTAVLMFQNCEGQNHKQDSVHRPQLLKRKETLSRFEPSSLYLPA